jgi:hypothetical protein
MRYRAIAITIDASSIDIIIALQDLDCCFCCIATHNQTTTSIMPYSSEDTGDFDKLRTAFTELTAMFGSVEDLLKAFGLADMPQAQRYGILFGCLVFITTVTAVVALLVMGGTMKRIQEQAETGDATMLSPQAARAQRALLLERLLEGRERMVRNYTEPSKTEEFTSLTTMLMNVAPKTDELAELVSDDDKKEKKKQEIRRYIPPYYEENYVASYRKCQDRPGGTYVLVKCDSASRHCEECSPLTLYSTSTLSLQELLFRVVLRRGSKHTRVALPVVVLTRAPRTVVPTDAFMNSSAALRMPLTTSTLSSGRLVLRTLSAGSFVSSPWKCLVI